MNLLTINNMPLPSPTSYNYSLETISNMERNASGTMVGDKIADKVKLSCKWGTLSNADFQKIVACGRDFTFNLTYFDPLQNQRTAFFYVSAPSGDIVLSTDIATGEIMWNNIALNFIER